MMNDKLLFRKQALKKRSELFESAEKKKEADLKILENLKASGLIEKAELVLVYVSYRDEADTLELIKYLLLKGIKVAVPRCRKQGQMDFFTIENLGELKPSSMGIPEPEYDEKRLVRDFTGALCIVPGTAFDLKGMRTGYGGGYYDRFLSREKNITSAGICYDLLIYDEVPSEPHDISVDHIITEKGLIDINGLSER